MSEESESSLGQPRPFVVEICVNLHQRALLSVWGDPPVSSPFEASLKLLNEKGLPADLEAMWCQRQVWGMAFSTFLSKCSFSTLCTIFQNFIF